MPGRVTKHGRTSREVLLSEAHRRAKRSAQPRPLKVGTKVIYEDERGRIHARVFEIAKMMPGGLAVIKGWPNGIARKGPMRKLVVARSALVSALHVIDETYKVLFDVPEDTKNTRYDYTIIGVERKRRRTKRRCR